MIVVSDHAVLRNDYEEQIQMEDGVTYPSAEHAFQAHKTSNIDERRHIASLSIRDARSFARSLNINVYLWDTSKYFTMENILKKKFSKKENAKYLMQLQGEIYMHSHNDRFWGCDPETNDGENNLGNILSIIRSQLMIQHPEYMEDDVEEEIDSDEEPDALISIADAFDKVQGELGNHAELSDDISEIISTADKICEWYNDMPGALSFHPELEKLIEKLGERVANAKKEIKEAASTY